MPQLVRANRGFRRLPSLRRAWAFGLLMCACAPALAAPSPCKLAKVVEFPVTMNQLSPEIVAKINGTAVRFVLDSGAFYSSLDAASASALQLRTYPAPAWFTGKAVGGRVTYSLAMVSEFAVPGQSIHNLEFIVGGSYLGGRAVGVVGRNILQVGDAEYDLADGVVRLMKSEDCSDADLTYWVRSGDAYSVIPIVKPQKSLLAGSRLSKRLDFQPALIAIAYVNGAAMRAEFDSGASTSLLSAKAAAKAGIKLDSPGVVYAGETPGFGRNTVKTYIAPVASFKLGEEEIRNTRLRVVDTDLPDSDMLIGADFFLAHHMYVANSQNKLYFKYTGGPVFNLAAQPAPGSVPSTAPPAAETPPPPSSADSKVPVENASEDARRGAALKARQEPDQALQAYNRACELAPDNANYFYERAVLYAQLKQPAPALADLDRAIQLVPHHVGALLMRAGYRTESGDRTGAEADLDGVNAVLPKVDNERLTLATEYSNLDLFRPAIEQYDLWSVAHPQDVRLPFALEAECRARALGDVDSERAMKDCDAALRHATKDSPLYAEILATRALVLFRLRNYDRSIGNYNASLKIDPKNAFALYGRGIDELRKQKASEGQADIAQAIALSPEVAENFSRHGIAP